MTRITTGNGLGVGITIMKKLFTTIMLLCCAFAAQAVDLKEDFSTLTKNSYGGSAEETVTLTSGDWKFFKIGYSNKQVKFTSSTSSYIETPALDDPGKIAVDWGSGGSNKLIVKYSVDGGAWQTLVESPSGGTGAKSYSGMTGLDGKTNVKFRFTGNNSNVYVTKITIKSAVVIPENDDPTYVTEGAWVPTKDFPKPLKVIYMSPMPSNETPDGSEARPYYNLQQAVDAATPGTHIICKGGTYYQQVQSDGKFTVRIKSSGTADAPIIIRCADGEKPVFDFKDGLNNERVGERGILLTGDYWWFFGIEITHAADNGMKIEGNHNRIERCVFHHNLDTGLQLGFGHKFQDSHPGISKNDGSYCSYNDIVDCDAYSNCDYDTNWGADADGFACKMHNGKGNRFIRCRAWNNADDGYDLYETDFSVILAECWGGDSGKLDYEWVKEYVKKNTSMSFSGNGNGIKLGGNGTGGSSAGVHYAFNCIAYGCDTGSSTKGFDCNSHKDGHVIVGGLGFGSAYDYMFESGGSDAKTFYYNNVCLGKREICVGTDDYNAVAEAGSSLDWTKNLVTGVSADNFVSLASDDAVMPRDIRGGMPRKFGRLVNDPENPLIDAGNASLDNVDNVWQGLVAEFPFLERKITGSARDLGPYELRDNTATAIKAVNAAQKEVKTRKYFLDGQLIIVKDGVRYNALGQKL